MMFTLQQVITEVGVTETDLQLWIEQRWVLPHKRNDDFVFDDLDFDDLDFDAMHRSFFKASERWRN